MSNEAKRHAREILEADGYTVDAPEGTSESEHQMRVNAGYKAALNSTLPFTFSVVDMDVDDICH